MAEAAHLMTVILILYNIYINLNTLSIAVVPDESDHLVSLLQYISVSGAEPRSLPLPGFVKHRRLPARPQQPALPLAALHPAGPRGQRRIPQPQRGQQHRKPAGRHDAPGHRKLTGWVEQKAAIECVVLCVIPILLKKLFYFS